MQLRTVRAEIRRGDGPDVGGPRPDDAASVVVVSHVARRKRGIVVVGCRQTW